MIKHRFLRNKKLATASGVLHFDKEGLNNALDATEEKKLAKQLADIELVSKDKAKPNGVKAKSTKTREKPVNKTKKATSKAKSAQGAKRVAK